MTKKKKIILIAALVILAAALVILPKYFFLNREDLIRHKVKLGAKYVEKRDADSLAKIISEDYIGFFMNTKEELVKQAGAELQHFEKIDISIKDIKISLDENTMEADVRVEFFVSGIYTGFSLYNKVPFRGLSGQGDGKTPDVLNLVIKEDGDGEWRVKSIDMKFQAVN